MDASDSSIPAAPLQSASGPTGPRGPVLEIVGYLGAGAALSASSIVVGETASSSTQILTNLVTAAVLLAAGWLVGDPDEDAFRRMRSVFWFLGLISWISAAGVAVTEIWGSIDLRWMVFITALVGAALAFPLWWVERRSLQLIGLFVSLLVAATALVYAERTLQVFFGLSRAFPDTRWMALMTMAFGVGGLLLGHRGILAPRRTSLVLGSIALILGAFVVDVDILEGGPSTFSIVLALAVAAIVLTIGGMTGERAPAGIGIVGVLLLVSFLVGQEVDEQGPAIAVLVLGLLLVAATIALVRRGGQTRGA